MHLLFKLVLLNLPFLVSAFQLSLVSLVVHSGDAVNVSWSLAVGDPFAFGLMQRSLQDNQVKNVTPVANVERAITGSTTVIFDTVGQILLAGIAQLSLDPNGVLNQLAAGLQVSVLAPRTNIASSAPTDGPGTDTVSNSTTSTSTSSSTTRSFNTTSSAPNTFSSSPTFSPVTKTSTTTSSASSTSTVVIPLPTSSPTLTFTSFSSQSSPDASASAEASSSSATSINTRALVISLSVIGSSLLCLVMLYLLLRCQRRATRRRISVFETRLNRQASNGARSIMSFYSPNREDIMSPQPDPEVLEYRQSDSPVPAFTGIGRRGVTAPWPADTEPRVQTPTFTTPPAHQEGFKERFELANSLERSRVPERPRRDSWSEIMATEPLPAYMGRA